MPLPFHRPRAVVASAGASLPVLSPINPVAAFSVFAVEPTESKQGESAMYAAPVAVSRPCSQCAGCRKLAPCPKRANALAEVKPTEVKTELLLAFA